MLQSFLIATGQWVAFAMRAGRALPWLLLHPRVWLRNLYGIFVGSIPLAVVLGLALGAVVWMQTRGILERMAGATDLLPTVLAAAVMLELAPVGAGLILAARVGALLGAELAAMVQTEQVDALQLVGVNPYQRLIAPRLLACLLAAPLLMIVVAGLALGSGYVAEWLTVPMPWLKYRTAVLQELYLADVLPALGKTVIFGGLVGVTGCYLGLKARGGTEGVGQAATRSVMACALLVLLADVFCVGLLRVLAIATSV